MKNLQISEANARKLYQTAAPEFRQTLEDTFGKDFLTSITSIEDCYSYEDCCKLLGKEPMNEQALRAAGATEFGIATMRQETIVEAINGDTKINLFDTEQKKWQPWYHIDQSSSGFAFCVSCYDCSDADAGYASRLCLADEKRSDFYGKRFCEEIQKFMTV